MVPVTAIGLRRYTGKLPAGIRAAAGSLLLGGGGLFIAAMLTVRPHYAGELLPGWIAEGIGVGLALPTFISAATAGLAPHQASAGSAVVQMGRQVGSVIGVAILVVVIGSSAISPSALDRFTHASWYAAVFALVAALTCLGLLQRAPHRDRHDHRSNHRTGKDRPRGPDRAHRRPEPVRGKSSVVIEEIHLGEPEQADELLAPLSALGPVMDAIQRISAPALSDMHLDPEHPVPAKPQTCTACPQHSTSCPQRPRR
jgi:MFS family permease